MELVLNSVWLLVAVCLIYTWRVYWRKPRWCVKESTCLVLLLVLLFFAISMTDDVHLHQVLAESSVVAYSDKVHSAPAVSIHVYVALAANPVRFPIRLHWLRADQNLFYEVLPAAIHVCYPQRPRPPTA
jgi:hypothetical protein